MDESITGDVVSSAYASRRERRNRSVDNGWRHLVHLLGWGKASQASESQEANLDERFSAEGEARIVPLASRGPQEPPPERPQRVGAELHRLVDLLPQGAEPSAVSFLRYLVDQEGNGPAAFDRGVQVLTRDPAQGSGASSVVVLVGPCEGLMSVSSLTEVLEEAPNLEVHFRLFKDGFFRADGVSTDIEDLAKWLSGRDEVQSVAIEANVIHVVPRSGT